MPYTFDGVDEFLQVAGNTDLVNFTGDFTISIWVMENDTGGQHNFVFYGKTAGSGSGWLIKRSGPSHIFNFGTNINSPAVSLVTDNSNNEVRWKHYVGVRRSTTCEFYLDSTIQADTDTNSDTLVFEADAALSVSSSAVSAPVQLSNGEIAHLAIWKTTGATAAQVKEIYGDGILESPPDLENLATMPSPTQWWKLNDPSTFPTAENEISAIDLTANNMEVADVSAAGEPPDPKAVKFVFQSGHATVGNVPALINFGTGDFFASAWTNSSAGGNMDEIACSYGTTDNVDDDRWFLGLKPNFGVDAHKVQFGIGDSVSSDVVLSNADVTPGNEDTWTHILGAVVGGVVKLWVNAVLQDDTQATTIDLSDPANGEFALAALPKNSFTLEFSEQLRYVGVWSDTITQAKVNRIYGCNQSQRDKIPGLPAPIVFYLIGDGDTYPVYRDLIGSNDATHAGTTSQNDVIGALDTNDPGCTILTSGGLAGGNMGKQNGFIHIGKGIR